MQFEQSGIFGVSRCLHVILLLAWVHTSFAAENEAEQVKETASPQPSALLVGCTKYDFNPDKDRQLSGPANDVALISDLLVERFGFPITRIRSLVEGKSPKERPTRANIVREMETLIREARAGQRIVLFFAGHGCQQPDQVPADPNDPEPDGLDEVFLPCDIGPWSAEIQSVRNAIVDDEFRRWTSQLLDREVDLLVIFDSCHSGTGLRDIGDERPRRLEPEVLIPADVLAKVRGGSETARGQSSRAEPFFDPLARGKWVALYAAQPGEITKEATLPKPSTNPRRQGVFTYTLCQALREGNVPSYRELIQRIRADYLAHARYESTPMIEGLDLDRNVLGVNRGPSSYVLEKSKGEWFVRAGQLHGLTMGSILAVRSSQSSAESPPIGFVEVVDAELARATVRLCDYQDHKKVDTLPDGALCRVVFADYGDLRLKVAVDEQVSRGIKANQLLAALRSIATKDDSPLAIVEDIEAADWVVSHAPNEKDSRWLISPRSARQQTVDIARGIDESSGQIIVAPANFEESLRRLNRATNLLALASRLGGQSATDELGVQLDILYQPRGTKEEIASVSLDRLLEAQSKGKLKFRVTNRGKEAVDFTLLFVDSQYGIEPVFPRSYSSDNRLPAGKVFETAAMSITADTVGREHLVLIAVKSEKIPASFTFLAQPNLVVAREELAQARGGRNPSPLESLLQSAAWATGTSRGLGIGVNSPIIQTRSWVVQP